MSTRVRVAAVLVTMLCVACDREHDSQQSPEASAVGTSGRSAGSVTAIVHASEPPVFVGRDRDGARLWTLTQQFYQKRGDALAWIDGGKPRKQMDELIAALQ